MYVRLGVSQKRVIVGKFPQEYLFLTGGWYPIQTISDAGAVRLGDSCIYSHHSGLIICKSGRIYFEAVEREAWLRQLVQGYGGYICRDDSENRLAGRVTGNPAEPTGLQALAE